MKKVFPLTVGGKAPARVVDAIKHEVRKYVKRERQKDLPEGFEVWDFSCRVGPNAAEASVTTLKEIGSAIDAAVIANPVEIYVELLAVPAKRVRAAPSVTESARLE
jgi:hypothetical protein